MTLKLEDIDPNEDIRMKGADLIGYLAGARLEEAKEIFWMLWDEDGSPFQRDDPPTEMLAHIIELEKLAGDTSHE